MDTNIILSIVLAGIGTITSIVIWLASGHAVKVQEQNTPLKYLRQVDDQAYERARKIYEGAIDQLESEIQRVNTSFRDFQTEKEAEVARLNVQLRDFQLTITKLNTELVRLRGKIDDKTDPGIGGE